MADPQTIGDILVQLHAAGKSFSEFCFSVPSSHFYQSREGKWSVAQHIVHLTIAAKSTRPAYSLPKFLVRLYTGKPNRPSRTYGQLVEKYKQKLAAGGKASGKFIPPGVSTTKSQQAIIKDFDNSMNRLSAAIQQHWKDPLLDNYLAPHPLLGKITLRELGYFTIYHTYHHLDIIRKMISPENQLA